VVVPMFAFYRLHRKRVDCRVGERRWNPLKMVTGGEEKEVKFQGGWRKRRGVEKMR